MEIRQREAEQPLIQRITEAPQHALADLALEGIDGVFEGAVDEDEREKRRAEDHQVRHLIEFEPEQLLGEMLAADRPVDDRFWQVERVVEEREGRQRQQQQQDLLLHAVLQDEAIDRRFEVADLRRNRRPRHAFCIGLGRDPRQKTGAQHRVGRTGRRRHRLHLRPPETTITLVLTPHLMVASDQ